MQILVSDQSDKLLNFFNTNLDFLCTPLGIFFAICTLTGVIVAVFSYPKHSVRNFLIYAVIMFFGVSFFHYYDLQGGYDNLAKLFRFFSDYLGFLFYGVGYVPIFSLFYWFAAGVSAICAEDKELSVIKRILLVVMIGFIVLIFARICNYIALSLVWLSTGYFDKWRATF